MAGFPPCRDPTSVRLARGASFYTMWALQSEFYLRECSSQQLNILYHSVYTTTLGGQI
jgi:hypothetical protein